MPAFENLCCASFSHFFKNPVANNLCWSPFEFLYSLLSAFRTQIECYVTEFSGSSIAIGHLGYILSTLRAVVTWRGLFLKRPQWRLYAHRLHRDGIGQVGSGIVKDGGLALPDRRYAHCFACTYTVERGIGMSGGGTESRIVHLPQPHGLVITG